MDYTNAIEQTVKRLDKAVTEIWDIAVEAANAEATFKSAYAQSRLRNRYASKDKPTEAFLNDLADAECEELRLQHLVASAQHDAAKIALRGIQSQLDGLRTLAAGVRAIT